MSINFHPHKNNKKKIPLILLFPFNPHYFFPHHHHQHPLHPSHSITNSPSSSYNLLFHAGQSHIHHHHHLCWKWLRIKVPRSKVGVEGRTLFCYCCNHSITKHFNILLFIYIHFLKNSFQYSHYITKTIKT